MKLLKITLFLLLAVTLTSSTSHKFYVSITKVTHNEQAASLEIITKIFIDDIEKVLNKRYQTTTHLNTKKETPKDQQLLEKYIKDKLKISVNGKQIDYNYLGVEYEIDIVKSYIEIKGINNVSSLDIENKILFDGFDEQQNIIHIKVGDTKRSLILDKDNPKGLLNFQI